MEEETVEVQHSRTGEAEAGMSWGRDRTAADVGVRGPLAGEPAHLLRVPLARLVLLSLGRVTLGELGGRGSHT